jgi:hydroxymethylbilane synthase
MGTQSKQCILGTRGSELALWQTHWVRQRILESRPDFSVEVRIIRTTGDADLATPLAEIGDKGLFTKELESALLAGEIDAAVHSLKDMPTQLPEGLAFGAISEREDVRDAFVSHPSNPKTQFSTLPASATIATGSLRRTSQILAKRPDLRVEGLRGNVHTRLRKLEASRWSGIVLAAAGLKRLGLTSRISEYLPTESVLPAVGQGALAVEIRASDERMIEILQPVDSAETRATTSAERALLRHLEGGCQVPIGALGTIREGRLTLEACIGSLDGTRLVRGRIDGQPGSAESLGIELANRLLADGGASILDDIRRHEGLRS